METVALSPRMQAKLRTQMKRRVTEALKDGPMNCLTLAACKRATDETDGFRYSDEGKHPFYAHDKQQPHRIGLYLEWASRARWGRGDYEGANLDARAMHFELAAHLTRRGWTVTVEVNSPVDPGRVVIWADLNGLI